MADGYDVLDVEVPNGAGAASGGEGVNVGAGESGGVLAFEDLDGDVVGGVEVEVPARADAEVCFAAGEFADGVDSGLEGFFVACDGGFDGDAEGVGVDGCDEEGGAGGLG